MGQRSSRCKEEKDLGNVHSHGSPPKSFTSLVEAHPHSVGVGEENVNGGKKKTRKEDTSKKKKRFRLWRWTCCWRAGQKYSRKTSSTWCEEKAQDTDAEVGLLAGRIPDTQSFLQQDICSVENQNHQEPSTSDPETLQAAELSNCCDDVAQTLFHTVRTVSDWSIGVGQTLVSPTEGLVSPLKRQLENNEKKTVVINSCRYVIGDKLGEGTFGSVYEGSRLLDDFKVAVKIVTKTVDFKYISIPCHSKPLPLEVALNILANSGPTVPEIIQLLDWQDQDDHYIMVLERPTPCEDLFGLVERHGGINEGLACVVMRQATQAAYMCCLRGVFHRDIKLENLLINKKTHEVKLIDFGCGDLIKKSAYNIFTGTNQYCPPEYEEKGEYHGKPATVWSLGMLLFVLVCGDYPNSDDLRMINANNYSKAGLSEECCHLIRCCLQREPEQRLRLSEILHHNWFKIWKTPSDCFNQTPARTPC